MNDWQKHVGLTQLAWDLQALLGWQKHVASNESVQISQAQHYKCIVLVRCCCFILALSVRASPTQANMDVGFRKVTAHVDGVLKLLSFHHNPTLSSGLSKIVTFALQCTSLTFFCTCSLSPPEIRMVLDSQVLHRTLVQQLLLLVRTGTRCPCKSL